MGNLVRKPYQRLINSVVTTSGSETIAELTAGDGVFIRNYGNIKVANVEHNGVAGAVFKAGPQSAVLSKAVINIKPKIPAASGAAYDGPLVAGIHIKKVRQLTGRTEHYHDPEKDYTGVVEVPSVASANGVPATADMEELRDQIVSTIQSDTAKSYVYAGETMVVKVDDRDAAVELDISDGTTTSTVDGDDADEVVDNINDDSNALAYAWEEEGSGTVSYLYIVPRGNWDITCSGMNTANEAESSDYLYCIGIVSKSEEYMIEARPSRAQDGTLVADVKGSLAYMSTDDIRRKFPIQSWHFHQNPTIPMDNTDYYKYVFVAKHDAYSLEGMNHMDTYKEVAEFYVADSGTNIADWDYELEEAGFTIVNEDRASKGASTLTLTGASGAGAGTFTLTTISGLTVSSKKFYAGASNTGTINETTGVIANGTDEDIFYAEIIYSDSDTPVVSKITCTAVATGSFTGAAIDLDDYEYIGSWKVVIDTDDGTPVKSGAAGYHSLLDLTTTHEEWYPDEDNDAGSAIDPNTGAIDGAVAADVFYRRVKFAECDSEHVQKVTIVDQGAGDVDETYTSVKVS